MTIAFAAVLTVAIALKGAPVQAGETMLRKHGLTISLYRNSNGCLVLNRAGGWNDMFDNRRKLGPGDARSFKKPQRAYKKDGRKIA
ncbi:MAG: hypothetical protein AB3N09_04300 [Tateyamaria sp.]